MNTNTKPAQSTDEKLAEYLAACGVLFNALYIGQVKREDWDCDQWKISFQNSNGRSFASEYFTGLGLRAEATDDAKKRAAWSFPGLTRKDIETRTIFGRRYLAEVEKLRKPQGPTSASVLHSLILDSQAGCMTFAEWCADFGYETDSHKALATYDACQQTADSLHLVFNVEQLQTLADMLTDY